MLLRVLHSCGLRLDGDIVRGTSWCVYGIPRREMASLAIRALSSSGLGGFRSSLRRRRDTGPGLLALRHRPPPDVQQGARTRGRGSERCHHEERGFGASFQPRTHQHLHHYHPPRTIKFAFDEPAASLLLSISLNPTQTQISTRRGRSVRVSESPSCT
ncbi:hypothetical protein C8Q78DRAFT_721640 [Trametes maxima]|nr:hypothetical protein C8Q78DRAFT_721640 [Trametes maxima]